MTYSSVDDEIRQSVREYDLYKNRAFTRLFNAVENSARSVPDEDRYSATMAGLDVVYDIADATNESAWNDRSKDNYKMWRHVGRPVLARKKRLDPYILNHEIQAAAARYLALPYRVDELDRLLVDLLTAAEMFAFADEVQPVLKQQMPLPLKWILNNIASVVGAALISGFLLWLWPNSTIASWAAAIIFGLVCLGTAWSVIAFPFFYPGVRQNIRKIRNTIDAMLDAYCSLGGEPASTKHVRERLERATEAGAVWPAQLFVLMDDIEGRRTSF